MVIFGNIMKIVTDPNIMDFFETSPSETAKLTLLSDNDTPTMS